MMAKRIPTIRSRLTLLVVACIIPAWLMAVALLSYNYHQDRARLVQESMATARAIMSAVDREFSGMQAALLALATSPHLAADDLAAFYKQAQQALKTLGADNIVLLDRTGQQRLNTLRPFGSRLPSNTNPAVRKVFTTGAPVTADLYLGPVRKEFVLVVAVPVYRGDQVAYALAAAIWPERLSGLLAQQRLAESGMGAAILDSSGTIVARSHQSEVYVGAEAAPTLVARTREVAEDALEIETLEGLPVLSVFSRSAISNWTVAIALPLWSLATQVKHTLWWLLAGTAILLLGSLALAWAIGGTISASVRELTAPALALGSGEAVTVRALPLEETDAVGKALTRASRMLTAAQHRANHDELTGLANRALFDAMLAHQLALCRRNATNFALFYIDLDEFKPVNDRHGHAAGDEVLRAVAARLKQGLRESDVVARLGGDEFAVILAQGGMEAAQQVAAKLIDSLCIPYSIGPVTIELSASIGIAAYPDSGTTSEALSLRADEAMYKAKAAGKRSYAVAG